LPDSLNALAYQVFCFGGYKSRSGVYILKGAETSETQEQLEESLMNLGGMTAASTLLLKPNRSQLTLTAIGIL